MNKEDCSNFPTPCPDIDIGWFGGNATHMPTQFHPPGGLCRQKERKELNRMINQLNSPALDDNRHEGWCSGDWTLGMISDKVVIIILLLLFLVFLLLFLLLLLFSLLLLLIIIIIIIISDKKVVIPDHLKPGKYVVSWRWDREK